VTKKKDEVVKKPRAKRVVKKKLIPLEPEPYVNDKNSDNFLLGNEIHQELVVGVDLGSPEGDFATEVTVKKEGDTLTIIDEKLIDKEAVAYPVTGPTKDEVVINDVIVEPDKTFEVPEELKTLGFNLNPQGSKPTIGLVTGGEMTKKHHNDAGLDIKASANFVIPAQGFVSVPTGLHIAVPVGYVGLIKPRSGLGFGSGIDTGSGVIDSGYTGEVKVLLFNHSSKRYEGGIGDRVAQLLTIPVNLENYTVVDSLDDTDRGGKGFGHSGTNEEHK